MADGFLDLASTPSVGAAQAANGSAGYCWAGFTGDRSLRKLTQAEADSISARDSFYMAANSESGWPHVQHRGGPAGFLRVLDERTLGFADFRGNRQYTSVGNVAADDRVALIVVDYPGRRRLKIYAHAQLRDLAEDDALSARLMVAGYKAKPERAILLRLGTFDWNCPQQITPCFAEAELAQALDAIRRRIAELQAENEALRTRLDETRGGSRRQRRVKLGAAA